MTVASELSSPARRAAGPLQRLGVRWRLLLAFFGISAFAVIAAAAGLYSFAEVGGMLRRITEERVPPALASLELSQQAARIVAAAPALLAVTSNDQLRDVSASIAGEVGKLEGSLRDLQESEIHPAALAAIEPAVDGLQRNLIAIDALIANRLAIAAQREQLLRQLSSTNIATQRLVAPGILVMDSKIAEWRHTGSDPSLDEEARSTATAALGQEIATFLPHQKAQIELSAINDGLLKAASAQSQGDLPLLAFPLRRSLFTLEALASEFDETLRPRLIERIDAFRALIEGPGSIPEARQNELAVIAQAEALLRENATLSRELTAAVDRLVSGAKSDIANASSEAFSVQRLGSGVLIAVVVLSLACSGLIVWLYVGRNLIARLTALSDSMLAIAGGNLRAPLPAAGGHDEIDRMAEALAVFRDTAVEVEEKSLRDLHALLETIEYGVLMLDPDLRVRIYNRAFCDLAAMPPESLAGRPHFRDVLEHVRHTGAYAVPDAAWDDYVSQRLEEIRRAQALPAELPLADGRILEYRCVPLADGGRMLTYYDLSHLKRVEEALRAAKEQAELANRAKSEFLANMSHELRTPLNAIIGFTRLVMRRAKDALPDKQYDNLGKILASAEHLLSLINSVLDLSKIEAGRIEVRLTEFALEPVIDQCLRTVEPMVKGGLRLEKQIEPDLPTLCTDQEKLRQILINLLANAVKFTEVGKRHGPCRPRARRDRARGRGHRHRHSGERQGAGVRGVPAGRQQQHPAARRHRPRAADQPSSGAPFGRRHHAREPSGSRLHVHAHHARASCLGRGGGERRARGSAGVRRGRPTAGDRSRRPRAARPCDRRRSQHALPAARESRRGGLPCHGGGGRRGGRADGARAEAVGHRARRRDAAQGRLAGPARAQGRSGDTRHPGHHAVDRRPERPGLPARRLRLSPETLRARGAGGDAAAHRSTTLPDARGRR